MVHCPKNVLLHYDWPMLFGFRTTNVMLRACVACSFLLAYVYVTRFYQDCIAILIECLVVYQNR